MKYTTSRHRTVFAAFLLSLLSSFYYYSSVIAVDMDSQNSQETIVTFDAFLLDLIGQYREIITISLVAVVTLTGIMLVRAASHRAKQRRIWREAHGFSNVTKK